MDITKFSVTELKALLFDIDQQIKKLQQDYQVVGMQLEKTVEKEEAGKDKVGEKKEE